MNDRGRNIASDYLEFTFKPLSDDYLHSLIELQDQVYQSIPDKSHFALTTSEEFADSHVRDYCLGAFCGDVLAGATCMVINRDTPRNLGAQMGFDPLECVTLDTSFVHPDYRGRGLQRAFIRMRLEEADRIGARWAFGSVAPGNTYSLANIRSMGFTIHKVATLYDGLERLVMIKELRI